MSIRQVLKKHYRRRLHSVVFARCYNAGISSKLVFLSAAERAQLRQVLRSLEELGHITLSRIGPLGLPLTLSGALRALSAVAGSYILDAIVRSASARAVSTPPPKMVVPLWEFAADDADGDVLVASGKFLSADILFEALKVTDPDYPEPVEAVRSRYERWRAAAGLGTPLTTVRIPGWPGDYVVFASPEAA